MQGLPGKHGGGSDRLARTAAIPPHRTGVANGRGGAGACRGRRRSRDGMTQRWRPHRTHHRRCRRRAVWNGSPHDRSRPRAGIEACSALPGVTGAALGLSPRPRGGVDVLALGARALPVPVRGGIRAPGARGPGGGRYAAPGAFGRARLACPPPCSGKGDAPSLPSREAGRGSRTPGKRACSSETVFEDPDLGRAAQVAHERLVGVLSGDRRELAAERVHPLCRDGPRIGP